MNVTGSSARLMPTLAWTLLLGCVALTAVAAAEKGQELGQGEGAGVYVLENEALRIEVGKEDLALKLIAKQTGQEWRTGHPFYMKYGPYGYDVSTHARWVVTEQADALVFTFDEFSFWSRFKENGYVKPDPGPELRFEYSVRLVDGGAAFCIAPIEGMDEEEISVAFPHGLLDFKATETAQVVFPYGFGVLVQFPRSDLLSFSERYGRSNHTMPLHGVFQEAGGLGVYIRTPFDCSTAISANTLQPHLARVESTFSFERDMANYPREIVFYPLGPDETYVHLAKRYRQILQDEGRFVTLAEKIKKSPEVEKLVGSVIWKHNVYSGTVPDGLDHGYSLYMLHPAQNEYEGKPNNWSAREIFETAHERGFDRVTVYNTGWNHGGFDSHYPTRFPPNPKRGTEEEFREAAEYARSLSPDFVYSVHDNYRDVYKNSSEFSLDTIITDRDGSPLKGGVWRGGRAYLMCTQDSLRYAELDVPRIADMLGRGSIYLDVLGCANLESCYHPAHTQSRRGDVESRRQILRFVKETMGSVATEGTPADCYCDIVDLGAYCYYHFTRANHTTRPVPVPVPFWQLVYHDAILNYTSESTFKAYGSEYILYVALYGMLPTSLEPVSHKLSTELREAYASEMVSHEFLVPPKVKRDGAGCYWTDGVAKTVFGDGTAVVANFMQESFEHEGTTVPSRDFAILKPPTP